VVLGALLTGCAPQQTPDPPIELSLSVDQESYRIGDPLVLTVRLTNRGRRPADVPRFDHETLRFTYGTKGLDARFRREPVFSAHVVNEPYRVPPGEFIERRFLFTRLTAEAGEYLVLASFQGALIREELVPYEIHARPASYRVTKEVGFQRDPGNGLLLKAAAVDLAKRSVAPGKVAAERTVLVPLGETGLFTWAVLLRVEEPGKPPLNQAVRVNAYTGRVEPIEWKAAEELPEEPAPSEEKKE